MTNMTFHLTGEKCVVTKAVKAFELATTTVRLTNCQLDSDGSTCSNSPAGPNGQIDLNEPTRSSSQTSPIGQTNSNDPTCSNSSAKLLK